MTQSRTEDLVEIQQLLAKYAVTITQGDIDGLISVFTPDGTYSAFGSTYTLNRFPELVDAAPKGLFMTGTSLVTLDPDNPDAATGTQPLCFIEHSKHDMRIGYYNDTYVRTDDGWRLKTRAMTFIRRSGDLLLRLQADFANRLSGQTRQGHISDSQHLDLGLLGQCFLSRRLVRLVGTVLGAGTESNGRQVRRNPDDANGFVWFGPDPLRECLRALRQSLSVIFDPLELVLPLGAFRRLIALGPVAV